ncbi:MAG: lysophospholipid acyltransferase family protein [Gemmatimonadota bacterium]
MLRTLPDLVPSEASPRKPPNLRHWTEYLLLRAVTLPLRLLPLAWARAIGARIGRWGYAPLGIRRKVVERQVAAAFPGLDAAQVARIARASYANLGQVAIELVLLSYMGPGRLRELFEPGDEEVLARARSEGKGVVLFSGHIGNWELAGAWIAVNGGGLEAIARPLENPLVDAYVERSRRRMGMNVVFERDAVRHIVRALREGKAIGLVADQGSGSASTWVPFFGRPARTPRGPAVFALRFDTPIIVCAAVLQPGGRYRFIARELAPTRSGDLEADVYATVAAFTRELESLVRRYPEQYFWQHRRWKYQPPDTPPELRDPVAGP